MANENKQKSSVLSNLMHCFSFKGRIRRRDYIISFVIYSVLYCIVYALTENSSMKESLVLNTAIPIILIIMVWFLLAQGAKRCHDLDHNGWWQIIPFYWLWLLFSAGDEGENDYGDDPKGDIFDEGDE